MARILVTNGGPHPPEKWAMTTAEQIFDVSSMAGDRLISAQKFQLSIAELLMPYQERLQSTERQKLTENADHIMTPYCDEEYSRDMLKDIVALSKGTPWQEHFGKPEVQEVAAAVIGRDLVSSQHVERLWHADNNPECAVSQSYKAMHQR